MPIEEVFKMMWGRMNFLENAVSQRATSTDGDQPATTISDLKTNTVIPASIQKQLDDNTAKINTLAQEVGSLKKTLMATVSNFNQSMQAVGADFTEMNNKYTQMNNFLMEIQTTQITVNNKILKHYNDNYSDLLESHIEREANQKFNASVEASNNTSVEETETQTEQSLTAVTVEETTATVEETAATVEETAATVEETAATVEETAVTVEETAATVEETIARGEAEQAQAEQAQAEQAQAEQAQAEQAQAEQAQAEQAQAEQAQAEQPKKNNVTFNIE
jgi:hypothetical protein